MKIKVTVELTPSELRTIAPEIEHELRQAIGPNGDIAIQPQPCLYGAALDVLRSPNPISKIEQMIVAGPQQAETLARGIGEIARGAEDDATASMGALELIREPALRPLFLPAFYTSASNVLADETSTRSALRETSKAFATLVSWEVIPVTSALRTAIALMRASETTTAGCILAASVAAVPFVATAKDLPEVAELRRSMQGVPQSYETSFVADVFGWSSPFDATSVKRIASRPISDQSPRSPGVAMALNGNWIVAAAADGVIQTIDVLGGPAIDTIRLPAGRMPTAIDLTVRPRQVLVASVHNSGRSVISVFTEAPHNPSVWTDRVHLERQPAGRIVTALRAMRSLPVFCAAECGASDANLLVFDMNRATPTSSYSVHSDVITSLHVPASRDHVVLSTSRDRTVALYDLRVPTVKVGYLAAHNGTVSSVSTEGDVVVVGGFDGKVTVSDLRSLNAPLGRKIFDSAVLRVAQGPNHLCAVSCQSSLHLMSLHVAEMPTARIEPVLPDAAAAADIAWVPGRPPQFFALCDANLDLFQCSPAQ